MTTICFDGQTLAADRQIFGSFIRKGRKIWRLSDGSLFGAAGIWEEVVAVRNWLDGQTKPKGLTNFTALLVEPDGSLYRLEEKLNRMPILERCHAVGSGQAFAITAMALGKTAPEAVRIAARFDPGTGGGVDVLTRATA